MLLTIALDGPVGAGKSSVADGVARKLGILHLDTGAMYRAFAWKALQKGVALEDEAALEALTATDLPEVRYENGEQHTYMDGQDVTGLIRTPQVSQMASISSARPQVRKKLLAMQQTMAAQRDVIMDGRDIGTLILPGAQLKIYLTASVTARARRRFLELQEKGEPCSLEEIEREIRERDYRDMHRDIAPLKQAADAVLVDSSDMSIREVTERIVALARERL